MRTLSLSCIFLAFLLSGCGSGTEAQNHDGAEFVPGWAKSVVWYQIFPERFRNGDPSNDPRAQDILGSDPAEPPRAWQVHPWGSDWYALQPYEVGNSERQLWRHLLRRRYGGDLQGIIDQLPYLEDLGITAIYLNPVFESPSLHKYDGKTYHHVDPNFGPDPDGDRAMIASEDPLDPQTWVWTRADELVLELISQVHARGMRIIFDGVFNHMGRESFAFQDLIKRQQQSPYADWFIVKSWNDAEAGTRFDYEGWLGVRSLPAFREDSTGIVAGPRQYIFDSVERWMNPKGLGTDHGIDGWRLDVAWDVGHPFWKRFRAHVKSINPDAYLTAEIVAPPDDVEPYLEGDEFDGEMNYNFAFTAAEFLFNPDTLRISATEFDQKLQDLRTHYPAGVAYVSQNLFGSHDANRIGSHIRNRGIGNFRDWGHYFGLSQAANNPDYDVSKPTPEDLRLQKLFAVLQMTYVGAPMVYYGDEVGMWGANDPDSRKPMVWHDIEFESETANPDGSTRSADVVEVNRDLLEHYRTLIHIRNDHGALQSGSYSTLLADDDRRVFAFERRLGDDRIVVILNAGDSDTDVTLPGRDGPCFLDLLENDSRITSTDVSVEAHSGRVLAECVTP